MDFYFDVLKNRDESMSFTGTALPSMKREILVHEMYLFLKIFKDKILG